MTIRAAFGSKPLPAQMEALYEAALGEH